MSLLIFIYSPYAEHIKYIPNIKHIHDTNASLFPTAVAEFQDVAPNITTTKIVTTCLAVSFRLQFWK